MSYLSEAYVVFLSVLPKQIAEDLASPGYHVVLELVLLIIILWLFFSKSYRVDGKPQKLTPKEVDEMIDEWQAAPLVPSNSEHDTWVLDNVATVSGTVGTRVTVNGVVDCLNLASTNFLGRADEPALKQLAIETAEHYGVGSCGPRGFFGTVDVHLELEKDLAKFLGVEEAIIYAYGYATIASAIPAYSKRGDIIFVDEQVCFSIQQGLVASRSQIRWFKHNDANDLERLLKEQDKIDRRNPKKAKDIRRFLVCEGIYEKTGQMAPLQRFIELKYRYKFRIFIDESMSFGVIGRTGKGLTEHLGVDVIDMDLICASMAHAIGSHGGFCCGRTFVVDHQRLSGQGYCFSASLPPLLATTARESLAMLGREGATTDIGKRTMHKARLVRTALSASTTLTCHSAPNASFMHLRLKHSSSSRNDDERTLQRIVDTCRTRHHIALSRAVYVDEQEHILPPPSILLCFSAKHDDADLVEAATAIRQVADTLPTSHS